MKRDDPTTRPFITQSAVLLIFTSSKRIDQLKRVEVRALANSLQHELGDLLRIILLDEKSYPDIFQSFEITINPTFVLLREGHELWRQEGIPEENLLTVASKRLFPT
ncbi:thioredoxin [Larkinella punicea]|uniref:Thioredoxin n=1 Tax=Larkinella punicea TaxID=2315727 RepID=A0A368JWF2_9BACT|nr:thioredoxin [Larkinella punicea]RCR70531.1 thioredoxin [Larkinella punicea]